MQRRLHSKRDDPGLAMLIAGDEVVQLDDDSAQMRGVTGRILTFRRRRPTGEADQVALWQLVPEPAT